MGSTNTRASNIMGRRISCKHKAYLGLSETLFFPLRPRNPPRPSSSLAGSSRRISADNPGSLIAEKKGSTAHLKEMKQDPEGTPTTRARKLKFTPKIPARKAPKPSIANAEPSGANDDVVSKELLLKIQKATSGVASGTRFPRSDRNVAPTEVAFGHGNSTLARSFPRVGDKGNQTQDIADEPSPKLDKEYVEPWDCVHSYYPMTLPLRRPNSGNPEILDEKEFGEASASAALDETQINPAEELGLMEKMEEAQMLFLQFPTILPLVNRSASSVGSSSTVSKKEHGAMKGCKLEDLSAGYMGKMMVYKSGKVKMKLGDVLFDISPGVKCEFVQDIAAINTKEKHCCILGKLNKRAVLTPDMDSLLASIDNSC
ncbi:RNA polymerase III RPC4 domain containing protein [Musa troglodytarum]|uniref:RNA polymerase III RPC4 domain containing protein n=1 Tax=Musa troglodytarum TaxID=320322 RepID=A0A9E7KFI4_9LILI|nr:RNA polymerase III RPC4 domain containing protein [Musa troglodytarum]